MQKTLHSSEREAVDLVVSISRRDLAACLLAVAGSAALPSWAFAQDGDTRLNISLPPAAVTSPPSFETFLALSQIVLVEEHLDHALAQQMFDLFMAEPWGPKHIASCYTALRSAFLERDQRGGQATVAKVSLPYGETWFISHLVTTWYVGVYYHSERPTTWITLHGAMMNRGVRGLLPQRYEESVGFKNWARPPVTR